MRIHRLTVENFRGIRSLDWQPRGRLVCLIGPGNSAKTTILDAIEIALLPRWFANLSDDDFYGGDTAAPMKIELTVGELPELLIRDDHCGHYLRGWSEAAGLEDEPREGLSPVITIRFSADASLEPKWHVVNDRIPEGVGIPMKDREKMGVARVGEDADRQLTWMRGSSLPRLGAGSSDAGEALAGATRAARLALRDAKLPDAIKTAASAAHAAAVAYGAAPAAEYVPRLGSGASVSLGAMELFEGEIPARMAGLGSRRLAALGIQTEAVRDGAILLVDEVESGLEPHRIARLLAKMRSSVEHVGCTVLTTHSPVVLIGLSAVDLAVVRRLPDGVTEVRPVDPSLQDVVRSVPEALLAKRIVVCEGKTEFGLLEQVRETWEKQRKMPVAHQGATIVTGPRSAGSNAPSHAMKIRSLGFEVALFADGDVAGTPSDEELIEAGVKVVRWSGAANTELRVARDLPESKLQSFINVGSEYKGDVSIKDSIGSQLNMTLASTCVADWKTSGASLEAIREAVASVANKQKWFKDIERGRALGMIVCEAWPEIQGSDLRRGLEEVEHWVYA